MSIKNNTISLQSLLDAVNSLPEASGEQATPIIAVNSSGLITATAGTKSSTHQLAFQGAKTITPTTADQIAVSSGYYTGGNITVKGDANLVSGNIKSGVSIFGVSGTLAEGSGSSGGGDSSELWNKILNRRFEEVNDATATHIGSYAFAGCAYISSIYLPAATHIGAYAFAPYYNIVSCQGVLSPYLPECEIIGNNAFLNNDALGEIICPKVTKIEQGAFSNCDFLTSVSFPVCTSIGDNAFKNCIGLTSVSFPACTTIRPYAFDSCTNLTSVSFPACTSIGNYAFESCTNLTSVSFPVCTSIGNYAFRNCYNLTSLTLGASKVCTLNNSNAFSSTPIGGYSASAGTYGSIYVPASLLTSYKTATNWTYFSSRFVGIDDNTGGDTEGGSATTIAFTINGVQCQAEEGMTWEQWCDSEYNTIGGCVSGDQIMVFINGIGYYVCDEYALDWYVSPSELIYDGDEYTTEEAGFEL